MEEARQHPAVSRDARERMVEAETNWPHLCQFLGCAFHQDWRINGGTPQEAADTAVADWDLAARHQILCEWQSWNDARGWQTDVAASVNDGLGVELEFEDEAGARHFMKMIQDKLIASVRADTGQQ